MDVDKIYHMDAFVGMEQIPDKSIDMVLTDPPYGTTYNGWDKEVELELFWNEVWRIVKPNGAVCIWSQMPFTVKLISSSMDKYRYEWIIEKSNATGFLNAKRMPLKAHESIQMFYKHLPKYNPQKTDGKPYKRSEGGYSTNYNKHTPKQKSVKISDNKRYPRDVLSTSWRSGSWKTLHPTQKPVNICEYMIKTYSDEGDIVLDMFMGSGTTAVAAQKTKRHYLGFEQDKAYWKISQERLAGNI